MLKLNNLEVQWKLLYVITLGQSQADNINQMTTIAESIYI
jgi:hypothetical protein